MFKKLSLLSLLLVLVSCNFHIEKRRYFKGYYVERSASRHAVPQTNNQEFPAIPQEALASASKSQELRDVSVSASTASVILPVKQTKANPFNYVKSAPVKHQSQTFSQSQKRSKKSTASVKKKNSDGFLYGLSALMGLSLFAFIRKFKSTTLKITNWAAKNKIESQALIAGLQIIFAGLGIAVGKNLADMGYELSNTAAYIFGGILVASFFNSLRQKASKKIDLFKSFFRRKLSFLVIIVSSFMTMIHAGNQFKNPEAVKNPVSHLLQKYDDNSSLRADKTTVNSEVSAPAHKETMRSKAGKGGLVALYIFLGILLGGALLILCCLTWCLTAMEGAGAAGILLSIVVTGLSVLLFVVVIKAMRRSIRKRHPKNPVVLPGPTQP